MSGSKDLEVKGSDSVMHSEDPSLDSLLVRIETEIRNFVKETGGPAGNEELLKALLARAAGEVSDFTRDLQSHLHELVKIGLALSAEKNLDCLLEMIVSEARRFTNADGGTLYIRNDADQLEFSIAQNDTLRVRMGGPGGEKISWPPVNLKNKDGSWNHKNVSAHCAIVGEAVNIADVYVAAGFDFQGTKAFDATTGYRSRSMLVIPMRDHEDEVIGVLQLLNAKDRQSGEVLGFPEHEVDFITSLASQAAIAITNMRLIKGLEELLYAFVQSIASAIDEKSPYTGGHVTRVAELTESIFNLINQTETGGFADVNFSPEEVEEVRLAAWMHDVGKVSTPEYVVDKSTKLETIFDRIELVRYRIELLKKDAEIRLLRMRLEEKGLPADTAEMEQELSELSANLAFLETANVGGEFLADGKVEKIKELAGLNIDIGGRTVPLLNENELENMLIRKGTLTGKERDIINNHVNVGIKMLGSLPFPKKLRRVPDFAGAHHEKLDGSGYPRRLKGDEISFQGRVLAVADVFEALTAADRPYKEGKLLSESMRILGFMVKDKHLDSDLCDFIVESGLVMDYARKHLSDRQQDDFAWKGKTYSVKG